MPSIIEDGNAPVSHAVGHLELLYNNTTKYYDSILSQDKGLPDTVEPFVATFLWLIWNVGYRNIARFHEIIDPPPP